MATSTARLSPQGTSPEDELLRAVTRLIHTWVRLARRDAHSVELSLPQVFLLRDLRQVGEMRATRWSDVVGASPSTASGLLDGLEASGYIRRTHDTRDRRQVLISLTPKGRRCTDRLKETLLARWGEACRDLRRSEIVAATSTLTHVIAGLDPFALDDPRGCEAPRRSSAVARIPKTTIDRGSRTIPARALA